MFNNSFNSKSTGFIFCDVAHSAFVVQMCKSGCLMINVIFELFLWDSAFGHADSVVMKYAWSQ